MKQLNTIFIAKSITENPMFEITSSDDDVLLIIKCKYCSWKDVLLKTEKNSGVTGIYHINTIIYNRSQNIILFHRNNELVYSHEFDSDYMTLNVNSDNNIVASLYAYRKFMYEEEPQYPMCEVEVNNESAKVIAYISDSRSLDINCSISYVSLLEKLERTKEIIEFIQASPDLLERIISGKDFLIEFNDGDDIRQAHYHEDKNVQGVIIDQHSEVYSISELIDKLIDNNISILFIDKNNPSEIELVYDADTEVADIEVADTEVADIEVADTEVADIEVADAEIAEETVEE